MDTETQRSEEEQKLYLLLSSWNLPRLIDKLKGNSYNPCVWNICAGITTVSLNVEQESFAPILLIIKPHQIPILLKSILFEHCLESIKVFQLPCFQSKLYFKALNRRMHIRHSNYSPGVENWRAFNWLIQQAPIIQRSWKKSVNKTDCLIL